MEVLLAPDVYVNASVAGRGLAPEQVVNRILGNKDHRSKSTPWILEQVSAMLASHPDFKKDAVDAQVNLIRGLVDEVEATVDEGGDWGVTLTAAAKAAKIKRVITDHPDLADKDEIDGVEFISTDAWMVEQQTPPPPPGVAKE